MATAKRGTAIISGREGMHFRSYASRQLSLTARYVVLGVHATTTALRIGCSKGLPIRIMVRATLLLRSSALQPPPRHGRTRLGAVGLAT